MLFNVVVPDTFNVVIFAVVIFPFVIFPFVIFVRLILEMLLLFIFKLLFAIPLKVIKSNELSPNVVLPFTVKFL